jgi:hypothetical protein
MLTVFPTTDTSPARMKHPSDSKPSVSAWFPAANPPLADWIALSKAYKGHLRERERRAGFSGPWTSAVPAAATQKRKNSSSSIHFEGSCDCRVHFPYFLVLGRKSILSYLFKFASRITGVAFGSVTKHGPCNMQGGAASGFARGRCH